VPPAKTAIRLRGAVADSIAAAHELRSIVYLSTTGLRRPQGDWVDETTLPRPLSERSASGCRGVAWIALGSRAEKRLRP